MIKHSSFTRFISLFSQFLKVKGYICEDIVSVD